MTIKFSIETENENRAPYKFECEVTQDTLVGFFELVASLSSAAMSNEAAKDHIMKLLTASFLKYIEPRIDVASMLSKAARDGGLKPPKDIFRHDTADPVDELKRVNEVADQLKKQGFKVSPPAEEDNDKDDTEDSH